MGRHFTLGEGRHFALSAVSPAAKRAQEDAASIAAACRRCHSKNGLLYIFRSIQMVYNVAPAGLE